MNHNKYAGESENPHLFKKGRIGRFQTKNRIKYGACCVSNFNTRDGFITERELGRMKVIAQTGCGIITNQGAYPDPKGEGKAYYSQLALYDDKFIPQFEKIAQFVHEAGAVGIQQILHAGRYGGIDLGYCMQPSIIPQTLPHFRPPREMSKSDIKEVIQQHVDASKRAIKAGWDGVEITSFMGYMLANFCSKFTNQRTDEYGGTVRNRGRFMVEMIEAIKQGIGDAHPLVVRLNGAELMDKWGGNSEDECFELIEMAGAAGADMISVTVGWQESPESSIGRDVRPGHWNRLAARARQQLPEQIPVCFGVRLPDPEMANKCIENGEFDFWEVCRPLLADPLMVHKVRKGNYKEIKRCVGSLNCLSRLFRDLPYTCTINPRLGHEYEPAYDLAPATKKKRILVIGAGPAGMECAIAARQRGHEIVVHEKRKQIGGSLVGYAIHDLANRDDLERIITYYEAMIEKLGIDIHLDSSPTAKSMREQILNFDVVVVAAGASVDYSKIHDVDKEAPIVDGLAAASQDTDIGDKVVILGSGKVGLALGEFYAKAGKSVTIVDSAKRIGGDVSPTWKWRHASWIAELGIETCMSSVVQRLGKGNVEIVDGDGSNRIIPADTIVVSGPMLPNQSLYGEFEWMIDEIYAIGDSSIPRDLTNAIRSGYLLGCQI